MNEFDGLIGKLIKLAYTDLDGEEVESIGHILYTLKNRAFVFQSEEDMRQTIVYNRYVTRVREVESLIGDEGAQEKAQENQENRIADQS